MIKIEPEADVKQDKMEGKHALRPLPDKEGNIVLNPQSNHDFVSAFRVINMKSFSGFRGGKSWMFVLS